MEPNTQRDTKKIAFWVVIGIVVIIALVMILTQKKKEPETISAPTPVIPPTAEYQVSNQTPSAAIPIEPENRIEVFYTKNGFSPATITVKKGDTIIFKNQSLLQMWVASDNHSTHELYPTAGGCIKSTFDSCVGLNPGQEWAFKFDLVGNWKYHNHLIPSHTGIILVK